MMAVRGYLHQNKLRDFTLWAASQGFTEEACKGEYEVLRLIGYGHRFIFYQRLSSPHITATIDGHDLIKRYLIERQP